MMNTWRVYVLGTVSYVFCSHLEVLRSGDSLIPTLGGFWHHSTSPWDLFPFNKNIAIMWEIRKRSKFTTVTGNILKQMFLWFLSNSRRISALWASKLSWWKPAHPPSKVCDFCSWFCFVWHKSNISKAGKLKLRSRNIRDLCCNYLLFWDS